MNLIILESKIEVLEVKNKDGFFFVNGFLIEENQKIKFVYKTQDKGQVFIFENLDKNETFKVTGDIFVKYKRYIYTAVNVSSVSRIEDGTVLIE